MPDSAQFSSGCALPPVAKPMPSASKRAGPLSWLAARRGLIVTKSNNPSSTPVSATHGTIAYTESLSKLHRIKRTRSTCRDTPSRSPPRHALAITPKCVIYYNAILGRIDLQTGKITGNAKVQTMCLDFC